MVTPYGFTYPSTPPSITSTVPPGASLWNQIQNANLNAVNFGIASDQSSFALYRYQLATGKIPINGERTNYLAQLQPQIFVILIGINNPFGSYASDINSSLLNLANGIVNMCDLIHLDFPCASIVLQAVFPSTYAQNFASNYGTTNPIYIQYQYNTLNNTQILNSYMSSLVDQINNTNVCNGSTYFRNTFNEFLVNGQVLNSPSNYPNANPALNNSNPAAICNNLLCTNPSSCQPFIDGVHINAYGYWILQNCGANTNINGIGYKGLLNVLIAIRDQMNICNTS